MLGLPMKYARLFVLALTALGAGCGGGSTPTSPSTTTPTTTVADPTTTEGFEGILPVGGFRFYSFTIVANGTVNVTLTGISGPLVPSTVQVGLGLGQPSATDCTTTTSLTTAAGSTPQITGTYAPGVYCVRVADVGNLFGPASFNVGIAHP
jgi:hypothetical protein